jgi:hypothetical protein
MRKVGIIVIALVVCGVAYSDVQKTNKKNPYAFVYQVDVELLVDGKPMTLTKQAGCLVENYSKAGGDKFGYVKPSGLAVSRELASGEVVIAGVPSGCKRFRKVVSDDPNAPLEYEIHKPLPEGFLPMMVIADKAGVPNELEMYASAYAYAAPAARLKLKSINMKALAPGTEFEPDAYDWLLKRGEGPQYVGFAARRGIKIPGMDELFDKHVPQREGVVKITHRESGSEWFFDWRRPYQHNNGNDMFPANMVQTVVDFSRGQDVRLSHYGGHHLCFKMDEGQGLMDEHVTVRVHPEKNGIIYLYHAPFEKYMAGSHSVRAKLPITYVFPSGETYQYELGDGQELIYAAKGRELYRRIPLGIYSGNMVGRGLEKHNRPSWR